MSTTLIVPAGFAYLAPAFVSTAFLLLGQTIVVSRARGAAGIPYPTLYADKAEMAASPAAVKFNCAQRAHQNTLESIAMIYMSTAVLGLRYPVLAASSLGLWVVSRVAYTIGYASGDPAKRTNFVSRVTSTPAILTLLFGSAYSAYELVAATL
ncbi:membrane-associated proteins in eicosanoid and glutathione metabolism [Mycena rosella]|uniref:Membrane-associated proteins in eicosanoid and glutathione metabolism n=1 Tax=Mycena rosella TaxID=1033263 RepID=A0AAD7DXT6_MYCRO|nr:membrane-associated proteins in eicosanoid and glutathione metabolism [Mycena rosella]